MRSTLTGLLLAALILPAAGGEPLTLFGASSLTDVGTELARTWTERTGTPVRTAFAASSTLARQIDAGAPADVFISADREWMRYLQQRGRVIPQPLDNVVSNELVVIAPGADARIPHRIDPAALAAVLPEHERLAVGEPAHVPAGRYARQALETLGLWSILEPRLARTDNVRGALALVGRGEAPLGIVYATDARISSRVRVVAVFPPETHDPIVYPAGRVVSGDQAAAGAFIDWLATPAAAGIWRRHGFRLAGGTPAAAAGTPAAGPAADGVPR
ncbi:MAG: molybdate ABC transporter substrate-binding protein [Gammaproteobacteria bacterium]|nr:molybdate ABC transporter substrate-binding protein [Gammaproteobacteria bacterium]